MEEENLIIIDQLKRIRKNGVIENFQIVISDKDIYLINSSVNYGKYFKSIFNGIGDIMELLGNPVGMVGGVISQITGEKLSKALKSYSEKSSQKKLQNVLKSLDAISNKKDGINKINFSDIKSIITKNGFILNGKTYIEINCHSQSIRLTSESRTKIKELRLALDSKEHSISIKRKFI